MQASLLTAATGSWLGGRAAAPPAQELRGAAAARHAVAVLPRARRRLQPLRASTGIDGSRLMKQRRQQQGPGLASVACQATAGEEPASTALALSSGEDSFGWSVEGGSSSSSGQAAAPQAALSSGELSGIEEASSSRDRSGNSSGSDSEASSSSGGGVQIDLQLPRRSMLVMFTCNKCEGRSERLVNPVAWNKGMVIAQCQHCLVWHKLADAANLVDEIRYADLED